MLAFVVIAYRGLRAAWTAPDDYGSWLALGSTALVVLSALTNLAGYKVYWGTTAGSYSSSVTLMNPGLATYVVSNLTPNNYYFAVTAINSTGTESVFSNGASKTVQ